MTTRFFVVLFICFFSSAAIGQRIQSPLVDFAKADSIAEIYEGHSLKDLTALTTKLTKPLSAEIEKVRAIYKWICNNIEYDYPLYLRNASNRKKLTTRTERDEWNKKFSQLVFKKLVNHHQTICTGYAYLFKEMVNRAGIPCAMIDGYGKTQMSIRSTDEPNHSWNAVQLNNTWYLCDPTWSSGFIDTKADTYVRKFNDAYFWLTLQCFLAITILPIRRGRCLRNRRRGRNSNRHP